MDNRYNIISETIRFLENRGKFWIGNELLAVTPKAQAATEN